MSAIKCKHCGDVITSTHVYDFKYCKCGKVFIDGGDEYLRYGCPASPWEDHLEIISE